MSNEKHEFYYHGVKMVLTRADRSYECWKVEVTDENGFKSTVYERTFNKACKYAEHWFDTTEERQKSHEIENKAIESFLENERKAGRTSNLD